MSDILQDLRDADRRGISPPQNWTTRAADEIERLRNTRPDSKPSPIAEVLGKISQLEDTEPAEWVDKDCPKCENGGMVAKDKFGLFCVVSGCGWKENIEENKP